MRRAAALSAGVRCVGRCDDNLFRMSDILSTRRLVLRPWCEEDAPDLYASARDPRVGPVAGWPPHGSVEESAEVIRTVFSGPGIWAVCLRDSGRAVGCVGLLPDQAANFRIGPADFEAGYWLGVPWWGQGLIPEAVGAVVRYAFVCLGAENLWCGHYDGNGQSERVQRKCGFRHVRSEWGRCELFGEERLQHISRLTRAEWLLRSSSVGA